MNKDEKRELRRKRLMEKGGTTMLITSGRVPGLSDDEQLDALHGSVINALHDYFIPVRLLKLMRTPLSSTIMSMPPLLPLLAVG